MSAYKVTKDFPSRNGVTQYKVGQIIQLDDNSRTKALVKMGYIQKGLTEKHSEFLARQICDAVSHIDGIDDVSVANVGFGKKNHVFCVKVREEEEWKTYLGVEE